MICHPSCTPPQGRALCGGVLGPRAATGHPDERRGHRPRHLHGGLVAHDAHAGEGPVRQVLRQPPRGKGGRVERPRAR